MGPRRILAASACADAGEEELFLDALSICAIPLAVLGRMLTPTALLDMELLPEEAALQAVTPPYKYLLACKVGPPGTRSSPADSINPCRTIRHPFAPANRLYVRLCAHLSPL